MALKEAFLWKKEKPEVVAGWTVRRGSCRASGTTHTERGMDAGCLLQPQTERRAQGGRGCMWPYTATAPTPAQQPSCAPSSWPTTAAAMLAWSGDPNFVSSCPLPPPECDHAAGEIWLSWWPHALSSAPFVICRATQNHHPGPPCMYVQLDQCLCGLAAPPLCHPAPCPIT